ncbi:MAG: MutH/Sau3AI family endonuclease, partial [Cetobacterium sp.]
MLFNKYDEKSIENYGKKLEGTTLREKKIDKIMKEADKGAFNKIVEECYFKIDNNNLQIADFPEAGVELKVTPLKEIKKSKDSDVLRKRKGLSMKERTVLTTIDYNKLSKETWETNSLKEKAFKILFCFYIWKAKTSNLDYIF